MKIFTQLSTLSLLLALFSVDLAAQDLPKPVDPATLEKLRTGADQGEPVAMRELAKQIWLKSGHPPPPEVRTLLEKAEAAGDPEAISMVGNLYLSGFAGLPRDPHLARRYWEKAAELSFPRAFSNLGISYAFPSSGQPDYSRALSYFTQGEVLGCAPCVTHIGSMYLEGRGVAVDLDKAFDQFSKAVAMGDLFARLRLALIYQKGLGRPQDLVEAYAWILAATEYTAWGPRQAQEHAAALQQLEQVMPEDQLAEARKRAKERGAP